MIHGGLPVFLTVVCAETLDPSVALTVCDADYWAVFYCCNVVPILFRVWMNVM